MVVGTRQKIYKAEAILLSGNKLSSSPRLNPMAKALCAKLAKQQAEVVRLQRAVEEEARQEVEEQRRREEEARKEAEEKNRKKAKKSKGKGKAKPTRKWSVGTPCRRCQLNGHNCVPKER